LTASHEFYEAKGIVIPNYAGYEHYT